MRRVAERGRPLRWADADAMAAAAGAAGDPMGVRDAALILAMSDAALGPKEAAALDWRQVGAFPGRRPGGALLLGRDRRYLGPATIRRIEDWRRAAEAAGIRCAPTRPLFAGLRSRLGGRLSPLRIRHIVQARARACGVAERVDGMSLAAGTRGEIARRATVAYLRYGRVLQHGDDG